MHHRRAPDISTIFDENRVEIVNLASPIIPDPEYKWRRIQFAPPPGTKRPSAATRRKEPEKIFSSSARIMLGTPSPAGYAKAPETVTNTEKLKPYVAWRSLDKENGSTDENKSNTTLRPALQPRSTLASAGLTSLSTVSRR